MSYLKKCHCPWDWEWKLVKLITVITTINSVLTAGLSLIHVYTSSQAKAHCRATAREQSGPGDFLGDPWQIPVLLTQRRNGNSRTATTVKQYGTRSTSSRGELSKRPSLWLASATHSDTHTTSLETVHSCCITPYVLTNNVKDVLLACTAWTPGLTCKHKGFQVSPSLRPTQRGVTC